MKFALGSPSFGGAMYPPPFERCAIRFVATPFTSFARLA
jgi:hypothetical protein